MGKQALSELLIATSNPGKILELESLLAALPLRLHGLKEFPALREIEETGATFAENATLKAIGYAQQTGRWTLADDSGLEVAALGGAPGVYSARYAGTEASDAGRMMHLLEELRRTEDTARRARFICAIVIATPAAQVLNVAQGFCEGHIAQAPRGTGGFGYDPIFIPDGYEQTFGELPGEVKQLTSHRAQALKATRAFLHHHLRGVA